MPLMCNTCKVHFRTEEEMRSHFKSPWHAYNMKRQLCKLSIVSEDAFLTNESVAERETKSDVKKPYCEACGKRFTSRNAFDNHLRSRRHLQNAAQPADTATEEPGTSAAGKQQQQQQQPEVMDADSDSGTEELEEDAEAALAPEECLFCPHIAASGLASLQHMAGAHSFFLPDADFLVDADGLLAHLGEKVGVGLMCLWCNERSRLFPSLDAVRKHMRDKGHCKMLFDGEAALEFASFYDYSASWADADPDADPDAPLGRDDTPAADGEVYELALPSGATIGCRALRRYFRQRLPPSRQVATRKSAHVGLLLDTYRAAGWQRQHRSDLAVLQRHKNRHQLRLGVAANKMQKHFRPQVIF